MEWHRNTLIGLVEQRTKLVLPSNRAARHLDFHYDGWPLILVKMMELVLPTKRSAHSLELLALKLSLISLHWALALPLLPLLCFSVTGVPRNALGQMLQPEAGPSISVPYEDAQLD